MFSHKLESVRGLYVMKDFLRSQAVGYTEKVAVSRKLCKIQTLLQQTINGKWYVAHRIALFLMTSSDLPRHSHIASFFKYYFRTVVQQLTRFQLVYRASRGPSAMAKLSHCRGTA